MGFRIWLGIWNWHWFQITSSTQIVVSCGDEMVGWLQNMNSVSSRLTKVCVGVSDHPFRALERCSPPNLIWRLCRQLCGSWWRFLHERPPYPLQGLQRFCYMQSRQTLCILPRRSGAVKHFRVQKNKTGALILQCFCPHRNFSFLHSHWERVEQNQQRGTKKSNTRIHWLFLDVWMFWSSWFDAFSCRWLCEEILIWGESRAVFSIGFSSNCIIWKFTCETLKRTQKGRTHFWYMWIRCFSTRPPRWCEWVLPHKAAEHEALIWKCEWTNRWNAPRWRGNLSGMWANCPRKLAVVNFTHQRLAHHSRNDWLWTHWQLYLLSTGIVSSQFGKF